MISGLSKTAALCWRGFQQGALHSRLSGLQPVLVASLPAHPLTALQRVGHCALW